MSDEYVYGVRFYGRGPFDQWFNSREEAIADAEATDDKHLPAEILRIPIWEIEATGLAFTGYPDYSWKMVE